ncbi:hypothetical protein HELRODRAFT_163462 [Helobdella robusta]|uniref:EGF-like domain-containing protein n=1 Tax=Helobdella robusta TaxID=6412 RepID=T1EU30_HELRO|nr:hypothetical protein HELRODRAFT_163462 [Helobdella robusta]ESN96401.1 hypothetical protein HELRODRAFT_163462 [Helobdella robusta]
MAMTLNNSKPGWLVVDLGVRFNIDKVSVHLGTRKQMSNFEVWLSNDFNPKTNVTITKVSKCATYNSFALSGSLADGTSNLAVREFSVFGYEELTNYHVGCYINFNESVPVSAVTTPYECFAICKDRGYKYLAIKKKICHCSMAITSSHSFTLFCAQSCYSKDFLVQCLNVDRFDVFRVDQCILSSTSENSFDVCRTHSLFNMSLNSYGVYDNCENGWDGPFCNRRLCHVQNGQCADQLCIGSVNAWFYTAECYCREGFKILSYNENCKDIDECKADTHSCSLDSTVCVNTIGSFQCQCKDGFLPTSSSFYCDGNQVLKISTIVLASVFGLAILLFIVGAIVFILKKARTPKIKKTKQAMNNGTNNAADSYGAYTLPLPSVAEASDSHIYDRTLNDFYPYESLENQNGVYNNFASNDVS